MAGFIKGGGRDQGRARFHLLDRSRRFEIHNDGIVQIHQIIGGIA